MVVVMELELLLLMLVEGAIVVLVCFWECGIGSVIVVGVAK